MIIEFKTISRTLSSHYLSGILKSDNSEIFPSYEIHIHYGKYCKVVINYFGSYPINKSNIESIIRALEDDIINMNSNMYRIDYSIHTCKRLAFGHRILK